MQNNIGHFPSTSNQKWFLKASKVLIDGCPETSASQIFSTDKNLKRPFSVMYKLTFLKLVTWIP